MKKLLVGIPFSLAIVATSSLASDSAMSAASQGMAETAKNDMSSQAAVSYDKLGDKLAAGDDDVLSDLAGALGGKFGELQESLKSNEKLQSQLNGVVQSLLKNDDVDAVGALNKLSEANLTPSQKSLLKDAYNTAAAFVTERNFSALDGFEEEVGKIVSSVREGNYQAAVQPLQKVWSEARLSEDQKKLLSGVFDQYAPGWRSAADTLNKGLDAAKGLGL